jgi:hypothetical protein
MVIVFEVPVAGLAQVELEVIIHVTSCPVTSVVEVKVEVPVPTFPPLTCHWYVGVAPPLLGLAVNVKEAPVQPGLAPVVTAITTAGTNEVFTVIVIAFEVAVVVVAHNAFDVNMQVTICPVVSALEV